MAPGGIAIAYNLPGVSSLNLSAGTIAKIFSGKITKWDDPAIKADNSGVTLPSTAIQTFHRSDSSGTTYNFTNYLTNVAKSDWTYNFGKTWTAPGGQGAKGSSSVAQGVKSTAGAHRLLRDQLRHAGQPQRRQGRRRGWQVRRGHRCQRHRVPGQGHGRRNRQ